ncbi:MAG: hypothetical protein ACKVJG_10440 [Candidatus Latescibacterota bacterium]|jgi:hypothetical protein
MNEVVFILLSAFFLAIPVAIKYAIAFQTRGMLDQLRQQERLVHLLSLQLDAMESEKTVIRRALAQVGTQRRQAQNRRLTQEERLTQMREMLEAADQKKRRFVVNGGDTELQMPVLEEVIDMDEEEVTA